jgi:hypothetical protein
MSHDVVAVCKNTVECRRPLEEITIPKIELSSLIALGLLCASAAFARLGRYMYRAWVTNMSLTPAGIWHFYDGRAGMEPRICELREDFALRKIPTASFAANSLYLEIVRLAYHLVTAFQRNCLHEFRQNLTLQRLRYKLFLLPGELTRHQFG